MAYFLTKDVPSRLEDIIRDASEFLVIISPYLKINDRIKKLLEIKNIEIAVLYRKDAKSKLDSDEKKWLDSKRHIKVGFLEKLHAKCYLNENYAILTSMNLLQSSEGNHEMGIIVSHDEEPDLYLDILDEADLLLEMSKPETAGKVATKRGRKGPRQATTEPYCPKHNKPWRKGKEYGLYHDGGCTSSKLLRGVAEEKERNLQQLNKWLKEEFGVTSSNLTPEQVAQVYATLIR